MGTKLDQNKLLQKYQHLCNEPEKQVNYLKHAINDIEENLIRNKQSYVMQMQKVDQQFQVEVSILNREINQLKSDFEAKSFHMKQIEKWLKATRGWILIRKYFYEQKYRKWEMDLLQILHRIQDPCKEFSKTVFGNPAIHSILKISSKTIQHYTSNHWKIEQSWLNYRQKIIESQLSTKTTDEIKSIQNKLCIRKMTQQMLCRYSNMKSNEEQEDHDHNDENSVSESNKLKHKQHGLTKYPFSVNHPLHTHEQQLMNALNEIKTGLNLNLFELNSKANDLHKLLLLIGRIKFDLKNEYLKYTQMSLNELDKKQQQLTHVSFVLAMVNRNVIPSKYMCCIQHFQPSLFPFSGWVLYIICNFH
ncbi:Moesin ezrin radixin 1 isoform 1 [Schistosoma japonicum]|uniref:Moesin ezrin radixin 1 isoform 1 n=1 Tax=Schistosoma japonicum TaxID=6182 RepID=A0A4Z2CQ03_SCHJA|nr:Moesin ezrin radixin 1 isoform 1 [Schistosoma japonicum]TNN06327.1 Moesin ezrin radixin 1 isoform 1 [Schistosoma japonicum]